MFRFRGFTANRFFVVFVFSFVLFLSSGASYGASTITGFVFDKQRNILPDVDIELMDELYRVLMVPNGRAKTDSAGRYTFSGLNNGTYYIRVLPFKYDLEDEERSIMVDAQNARGGEGSAYFYADFYLNPKKGGLADAELSVVFAQDVPEAAKKLYKTAVEDLQKNRRPQGMAGLNEAIKAFPDYYLALQRMGKELFLQGQFKDAIPYLFKAADMNPKSPTSFYYLGYSLHSLGKQYNKSALTSLSQAANLAPASVQVLYILGKVEREEGKVADAETHLSKAKKLSQKPVPAIYWELAQTLADQKKYKQAADELASFKKVGKFKPDEAKQIDDAIAQLLEKAKNQGT